MSRYPKGTLGYEAEQWEKEHPRRELKARLREASGKGPSRGKAGREPVTSIAKVEADRSRKNSRTKGNRAELDVAEMFSRWSGEVVRRTPQSGGWSSAKFGVTADLVCANPAFPFHVECKHRENWVLDDLVTGVRQEHDKSIVQWWKQCVESCPKKNGLYTKEPLLVFRRNRQPWLVMLRDPLPDMPSRRVGVASFTIGFDTEPNVLVRLLSEFIRLQPVPRGLANYRKTSK